MLRSVSEIDQRALSSARVSVLFGKDGFSRLGAPPSFDPDPQPVALPACRAAFHRVSASRTAFALARPS